jgi:Urm1 (Ubiquitin related modifier).
MRNFPLISVFVNILLVFLSTSGMTVELWKNVSVCRRPGILVLVNDADWELLVSTELTIVL